MKIKIFSVLLSISLILLCLQANIFYQNLTYVGNLPSYRIYFLIYGIIQSLFYYFGYVNMIKKYNIHTYKKNIFCLCIAILNIIGLFFPYTDKNNLYSQIHVYFNMIACSGAYVLVLFALKEILHKDILIFNHNIKIILFLLSLSAITLFVFGDINSLLEIILMVGLNYFFMQI